MCLIHSIAGSFAPAVKSFRCGDCLVRYRNPVKLRLPETDLIHKSLAQSGSVHRSETFDTREGISERGANVYACETHTAN